MTCVLEFAEPKTLEGSPRHLSSLKCIWLHPLPPVWSMTLVCLLFPSTLKAICSSPQMEPSSLSLVYTNVNRVPCPLSLREHVFPKQSEEKHSFLSTPIHPSFPCPMFSSRTLSCPCSGPEEWLVANQYGPAHLKNIIGLIVLIPTGHSSIQTPKCPLTLDPCSQVHTLLPWEPLLVASAS